MNPKEKAKLPLNRWLSLTGIMLAYAWILHYTYSRIISPTFYYLAQSYRPPTTLATVLSSALIVALAISLPRRITRVSHFVLWTLFLIAIAPSILITQYSEVLSQHDSLQASFAMAGVFLCMSRISQRLMPRTPLRATVEREHLVLAVGSFTLLFNAFLVFQGGASLTLVGLADVSEIRASYKDVVATIPLLGYVLQFQTACLNPLFMTLGLSLRRYVVLGVGVISQLLIYSVTGYKLTALSPVFICGIVLIMELRHHLSGRLISFLMTAAMFLALALDWLTNSRIFVQVFINRLVAIPGLLTSAFIYIFQENPKYLWSTSFLRSVVEPRYDVSPGYLVGHLFQNSTAQANANFIADGYANLGWHGVVIEGLFIVGVLAVLDAVTEGIPLEMTVPTTLVAALGLANNSAFSSVLTGGFGGLIIIFLVWPRSAPNTHTPATQRGLHLHEPRRSSTPSLV